jgi:DNA (cytosine-5)-methyltransferase 1
MIVYSEIEPYAAEWLRNLIGAGLIAPGGVAEGDLREMDPGLLEGARRFHAFAGIGLWEYALGLAGWPEDVPVWTGSCPCQPFSKAGKRKGFNDDRHLWPDWFQLIRFYRPPVVFGEQVASKDGLEWLDLVFADLEGAGYSCGAADLAAASVGAPHIRQRLYWCAVRGGIGMGDAGVHRDRQHARELPGHEAEHEVRGQDGNHTPEPASATGAGSNRMADNNEAGLLLQRPTRVHEEGAPGHHPDGRGEVGSGADAWDDVIWIPCRDGKLRPAQPGSFPLAHGHTNRVGKLRAYGNAIVPPLAATFIRSVMDVIPNHLSGLH